MERPKLGSNWGVKLGVSIGGQILGQICDPKVGHLGRFGEVKIGVKLGVKLGVSIGGHILGQIWGRTWDQELGVWGSNLWSDLGSRLQVKTWSMLGWGHAASRLLPEENMLP